VDGFEGGHRCIDMRRFNRFPLVAEAPACGGPEAQQDLAWINDLFESGRLAPVIDRTYWLAEVPEAFRFFSTADPEGQIVVTLD
jgi:NADPH:quinone reductase-like Zn-dependent oxidoreductase